MRVTVLSWQGSLVEFGTSFGTGHGVFEGEVTIGVTVEAELEAGHMLRWGLDAVRADAGAPRISQDGGEVRIVGAFESMLGDDLIALRLGRSVLTVEIEDLPDGELAGGAWVAVRMPAGALRLYPYSA